MKKLLIIIIFILFCFDLGAEENQERIKRNVLITDIGGVFNNTRMSLSSPKENYSSYENVKQFNGGGNFSFSYLRKLHILDNKLSLGISASILSFGGKINYDNYKEIFGSNVYQPIYYDNNGNDYTAKKWSYSSQGEINLLANYEIIKIQNFELATLIGIGFIGHSLQVDYTGYQTCSSFFCSYTKDYQTVSTITPSTKIGLLGYYNFTKSLAIGINTNYTYTTPAKFYFEDDNMHYKVKTNGIITTNFSVRIMF